MSVHFFIDQCVPRSVTESLRDAGYAVELLRDHLPINAKDPDVIARAQDLKAILVTLNGDFADIVNYPPSNFGGIIALQVKNHPESLPAIVMRQPGCVVRTHDVYREGRFQFSHLSTTG